MSKEIRVGISDYKITKDPGKLITLGLGSCVGIAIYDTYTRVGGLSHIMLPDSNLFTKNKKIEKFADLAIPQMAKEINGLNTSRLVAKIAGGASMFDFSDDTLISGIGERNVKAVELILQDLGIKVLGKDTGGKSGRTMMVDLEDFTVRIRTVNKDIIKI